MHRQNADPDASTLGGQWACAQTYLIARHIRLSAMPGLGTTSGLGTTETISGRRQDTARAAHAFAERADQIGDGGNRSGCRCAVSAGDPVVIREP